MRQPSVNTKTWVLGSFILLKFLLQYFLISPVYELHRDEFLYLDQGHHLAWGYLSVPPATSWFSSIIIFLGNAVFWVKFIPALFGALTMLLVWKAIEELKGDLFALTLGATCVLFSSLLRINTLYQPNSLDILCWTTLYFILIKYFNTQNAKFLYYAAVIFALGFLNKYNIVFLVLGIFPALLLTPQRKILLRKDLYYAIALALLLISPNLIWQFFNDLPVVWHMKELAEKHLVHVDRLDFLKSQFLFFAGSLVVIVSGLYALYFHPPYHKFKVYFWSFFFTLLLFLSLKAKDYYAIGLYPIYISFGSVYLSGLLKNNWKYSLRPIIIMIPLLVFIPFYNISFPNKTPAYILSQADSYKKSGMLRWEDGQNHDLPQDFADMLGWKELASKVDAIYEKIASTSSYQTLVLCDNYGQAGAINYYSKHSIKAVSFHADYINWFDFDQQYKHLIRVKTFEEKDSELEKTVPYFSNGELSDSISNPYAREFKTMIYTFRDSKIDVNKRIKQEIETIKNKKK
ncbi:ArnT family glycosyltransferase [Cyclobacterium amurskyense]|uniref:Glycosyl transferase, family 39 n=1 Tax=Cyclobacterium amurskyense TaxID=320787 RepID=A0A0H4PGH2_9BACT|nr:glycosyltransferase family 39 protein [Cyclobacterium amurskyense]AKP51913.1 Glycosyl transferase, family 39 [Cyclobacterium amurskyense]